MHVSYYWRNGFNTKMVTRSAATSLAMYRSRALPWLFAYGTKALLMEFIDGFRSIAGQKGYGV